MTDIENKYAFNGFMQYTKTQFEELLNNLEANNKKLDKGVIYLVRDENSNKAEIYFGNRKYADMGDIYCGEF